MFALWLVLGYVCGALPFSVWLGKWLYQVDPRGQADRNPGAANAFRAAGWRLGVAVLLLDFLKACVPVAIATWVLRFPGDQLFWVALMPTVGHAFSIFLRFRGGRALAVMFGVWTALTLYQAPLIMGCAALVSMVVLRHDILRTLAIPTALLAWLVLAHAPAWMLLLAVAQLAILAAKVVTFIVTGGARSGLRAGT